MSRSAGRSTPTSSTSRSSRRRWTPSSPRQTAIMMGQLGGLGVLDLEGLWTRYDDPEPLLAEIRDLPADKATARMQEIYSAADQAGARHRPPRRDPRRRGHRRRRPLAAAHPGALRDRRRRRRRPLRHPRHHGVGRARLARTRSRSTSRSSSTNSTFPSSSAARPPTRRPCTSCAPARPACSSASAAARHRPRAPPSASTPPWPRPWPMSPALAATTWTSPAAATCTSSPTAASAPPATSSRPSPAVRMPSCSAPTLARATDAPGGGFHWGAEAHHSQLPRGNRVRGRHRRPARGDPLRPGARRRRHGEPGRRAAPLDGHHRLLGPQGVPARRGRCRAVPSELASR